MTPFDPAAVSLRPALRTWLWPCLAFVVTAAVVGPIAYSLMADAIARDLARVDVDGRGGALGVWAMITFFTAAIPFLITRRLVNGPSLPSRGWSLVHPAFTPITDGYRSAQAPTLGDLLGRLERLGYQVTATACTAHGRARGPPIARRRSPASTSSCAMHAGRARSAWSWPRRSTASATSAASRSAPSRARPPRSSPSS
jgi:hypothetical protein